MRGAKTSLVLLRRFQISTLKAPRDPMLREFKSHKAAAPEPATPTVGRDLEISSTGSGEDVELALDLRRKDEPVTFTQLLLTPPNAGITEEESDQESLEPGLSSPIGSPARSSSPLSLSPPTASGSATTTLLRFRFRLSATNSELLEVAMDKGERTH